MDITAATVKRACVAHLKRAVRQQRYKFKKKYFDPYPLHLVLENSPVSTMSDLEWIKLVEHWKDEKKMLTCEKNKENRSKVQFHQTTSSRSYEMHIIHLGDKYKEAPPDALDMFKELHNSKKKGIAPAVQSAIAKMETKIAKPVEDGCEPKSVNDIVSEVLLDKTKKNQFLQNVGINRGGGGSSAASRRELQAELVSEKQTSSDLRDLVNFQRQQLDEMVKKQQAAEEEMIKCDEEMKQRQVETDALLRRLMAMIPGTQATR